MNTVLNSRKGRPWFGTMKTSFSFANFLCAAVLIFHLAVEPGHAAGTVVAWGGNDFSQSTVPAGLTNITAVAGGSWHSLALKSTGAVAGWGDNTYGAASAPSNLLNAVAIAAGNGFSLALQSNGTVVAWGGQTTVPAGLTNVVAVSAASSNTMALTSDGNVVSWGVVAPPPATVTNVVAIAAGYTHSVALLGNGTVAAWGNNIWGQTTLPTGLTNVVALAGGEYHSLALRGNGTVIAWGNNGWGQSTVPAGLSNVVAIAAGAFHSLALQQNGTVAVWGDNTFLQTNVPAGLSNVVGIAAGFYHSLAVVGDGAPVITVQPVSQYNPSTGGASFGVMAAGLAPLSYQWQQDGTNIADATNSLLVLTNLSMADAGVYSVTVSNSLGTVTSANVELPPVWRRPFFLVQPQDQSVLCNDTATFQAAVAGTKPLSYQWQFNGTNLAGATNPVLTLANVTGDGAGDYTIVVTNLNGLATSRVAVLTVIGQPPLITSPLTAAGKQGTPFSYAITGLHNPTAFMADGLPLGLAVNPTNGVIQGTPLESGAFDVTLGTANLCASAQTNLTLTVATSLPVITSTLTASGTEQAAFNYRIRATGSPTGFGAGNLPQGLSVNPATGIISGSPLYAGNYTVTISATNVWGVGTASLQLTISNALVTGLAIANLLTNYSSPYLLNFQFSLRDNSDPTLGNAVVADPRLFSVIAFEDTNTVNPSETSVILQGVNQGVAAKVLKANLVLDFSESIAGPTGALDSNGIPVAVDTEVSAAQSIVNLQPATAQFGVYEFHRDDQAPQQVQSLTTDKTLLDNKIAGIWTNYVRGFPAGSRCWDALFAAIQSLGTNNADEEHVVIFCSDGDDTSSTNTFQNVINTASNANVQVYCVGFGNQIDTATLQSITAQTQGRYYEATNLTALAANFAQIGKDLSGQYFLRWATLNRSTTAFMPSFQITYQGFTAYSPSNPPPFISGTNYIVDTNAVPPVTNAVYLYTTNYIISPYLPTAFAGDVKIGSLRLVSDAVVQPSAITLRATYVPRYVRQIRLHYRANWPCTVSLQSTNAGEQISGWSLTQTSDGAGGQWAQLTSSNQQNLATSIPFADFGPLLRFAFHDVLNASSAFSVFAVDNTIYTNTGNQSFVFENTNAFITVYPVLPYGTPVPWLIEYGFTDPNGWAAAETNDLNGNGLLTWQDYVAGLNPTNASAVFTVRNLSPTGSPGHYQITFSTALNRTYRVETSSDLLIWQTLQDGIAGTGGDITIPDSRNLSGTTQMYYRVAVY
jgi:hypothetical protein